MAEAAIAQHKREQLARKVAAEAIREARTSRVSQLANLIAASLEMVKKSGDALDSVVLKLVDHIEQDTQEQMMGRDGPKGDGNDDVNSKDGPSGMQDKLMKLMLSNPSDEQLEDAVAIMEGMKPKAEWDNMQSLTAQLGNLTNYMSRLEGKMTDEEEAQAIADRVLAEEAAANGEGGDPAAADQAGDGAPAAAPPEPEVEPATEADEVASDDLPVPKELMEQLNVLRGKKKYLEEIKQLELAVRALQEEQAAGFPPEVEPPTVMPGDEDDDDNAPAPEPAAE